MDYTGRDNLDVMNLAKNYNNHIFNWIDGNKNMEILDFGAGNGEFCNRFNNETINAIEIDDTLRERIKCHSFKNINDLNNKKFGLIYSLNVLEHIEDDNNIVNNLSTLLEDNGIIKILVPAKQEIYTKMDEKVGHFRRYEKNNLISIFEENDFEIVSCKYFDFLGYFATLVYKLIDNSGDINSQSIKIYDKFIFPISLFFDKITFGSIVGKNLMLIARKKKNNE